jgi:hypothetical protein
MIGSGRQQVHRVATCPLPPPPPNKPTKIPYVPSPTHQKNHELLTRHRQTITLNEGGEKIVATRKQINDRIEAYARAVRDRDAGAVFELFAPNFDHIVHGLGDGPENPWNTKRETGREGIRKVCGDFFSLAGDMSVEYTDRTIDTANNPAAMVVRVTGGPAVMENSLHIRWNDKGEIVFFYNWYGQSPDQERRALQKKGAPD